MGARNQVGIGLSYRPARLCSLATQAQTLFLESIPRPIAELKFSTQLTDIGREVGTNVPNMLRGYWDSANSIVYIVM
jgi:hypothetical protein